MIVRVLMEDTALSPEFHAEHALSLLIETRNHRLLFDMGQTEAFLENAKRMGADIGGVDTAILSHGHYDHGGGLAAFLQHNDRAAVYVHERAFERHFSERAGGYLAEIGLNPALASHPRIKKTGFFLRLDDEVALFSGVSGRAPRPPGNRTLLMESNDGLVRDDFAHEQNLIVTENGEDVLFAGCAHCGIENIIDAACALRGRMPRAVVGGFHLKNPGGEGAVYAASVAQALSKCRAHDYTGHCTGEEGYQFLAEQLGSRVSRIASGCTLNLSY